MRAGLRVPPAVVIHHPPVIDGISFYWPVWLKPDSGKGGEGQKKIGSAHELSMAANELFKLGKTVLVEPFLPVLIFEPSWLAAGSSVPHRG